MSFTYPENLKYTDSHEYIRLEGDIATIGITAFAIDQLGDVVFIELPPVGTPISQGQSFGTVESVKAVENLYAPLTGEVIEINSNLIEAPELISDDPYGTAWLLRVKIQDASELDNTMSAEQYSQVLGI